LTIKPLKKDTMPRGFLTQKEVNKLFDFNNKDKIWIDDISYYANMLSACTGMRISEIVAVRGDCLEKNTIRVDRQYKYKFGLTETKTHDVREVVIPKQLMSKLKELCEINRGGYIFSLTCGEKPVGSCKIRNSLNKALKQIGIGDEERNGRRISFHSWRHYFNTTMRSNNIMDGKLRAMVGHSSAEMTEHYTHFNASDFKDIQKVQNKIINFEKVV
jgi:integrase